MKRCAALCSFCILLLLVSLRIIWSAETEAPKPAPATYVGNEVCQACHAPAFEKFSQTMMGKIFLFNPRNESGKTSLRELSRPGQQPCCRRRRQGRWRDDHLSQGLGRVSESPERRLSRLPSARHSDLLGSGSPREPRANLCHLPSGDGKDHRQASAREGGREDAFFL